MVAVLLILFLIILLFGGLGLLVAKAFLFAALAVVAVGLLLGMFGMRRT
jgi:hypothetical protein